MSQNDLLDGEMEISLLDFLLFLKEAWKYIFVFGVLGLVISGIYLLITPPRYEVVANIAMVRAPTQSKDSYMGVNVEEPAALMIRMSMPGEINGDVLSACGFEVGTNITSILNGPIKLSIPRGLSSVVELKVVRPSPELAKVCAKSVVELIIASQEQILASLASPSEVKNKARLVTIEERIRQDKVLLVKAEQPNSSLTPTYFAVLSDLRDLEDEKTKLVAKDSSYFQGSQVQPPLYMSDNPVYPKKLMSLIVGFMGGICLGLLFALGCQAMAKFKLKAQDTYEA